MKIEEMGMTPRTERALHRNGIHETEQLLEMTPLAIANLRGIGPVVFRDIADKVARLQKKENSRTLS